MICSTPFIPASASADLNGLRMHVIGGLNAEPWMRPTYFRLARSTIETIVGNELCMQRRVNLSIQLPADDSSLLATHSDVWSGDSPFEVVVWVPLVDVYRTKSMYLLPPSVNGEMQDRMASLRSARGAVQDHQAASGLDRHPLRPCHGLQPDPDAWQPRQ